MKIVLKMGMLVLLGVALAGTGSWFGARNAMTRVAAPAPGTAGDGGVSQPSGAEAQRKVLYWHDPMYPQHKFDKPGKSPFMDMQLVAVYADAAGEEGGVTVSARVQQNLGLRTAQAEAAEFREEIAAVGYVQADERRIARAEVRVAGWVEKLHVRAVNDPVRAGQVLAELYSPELQAAQEEYLLTRRLLQTERGDAALVEAARRRLAAIGLAPAEIERIEQTGVASRRTPVVAPSGGVLSELGVREGAMLAAGMPAFTVTDLSSVWITIEVPEAQAGSIAPGQRAAARVQTLPERLFEGRVDYVYPELNAATRTVRARISMANPRAELKPGMFATVALTTRARKVLAVPSEAVIHTGKRAVVIVAEQGRFRAVTVRPGTEHDGRAEILDGLKPGERVVVSGQFLIDSEASLKGMLARFEDASPPGGPGEGAGAAAPAAGKAVHHAGRGRVVGLDAAAGRIELDHEPMPSIRWPAMKMGFRVTDKNALASLKPGEAVEFEMRGEPDAEGDYVIERIRAAKGAKR